MKMQDFLPGWKTKLGAILVFVSGGLTALGYGDAGTWIFNAGLALGIIGIRYQKKG